MRRRVKKWHDGDSGQFKNGKWFRLAGVRAPEKGKAAEKATRRAAGMTGRTDGRVNVKVVGRSYNRQVVQMSNKDGSVNKRMKKRGCRNKGR